MYSLFYLFLPLYRLQMSFQNTIKREKYVNTEYQKKGVSIR